MPSHGSHKSQPRADRFQQEHLRPQEFPVTELSVALECRRSNEIEVTQALIGLCKAAVSRFGAPVATHKTVGELIGARSQSTLLCKSTDITPDPRWERLAHAIIPPLPDGFPIATLRTTSRLELEALKGAVASLAKDINELHLKPISPTIAVALQGSLEAVRHHAVENDELKECNLNALRQLKLHLEVGPEWGRVTPLEHLFLLWCSQPDEVPTPAATPPAARPSLTRDDRTSPPSTAHLNTLGLTWAWSDKRQAWEPAPKNSRYQNSTLFDLSSHYFEARLTNRTVPLHRETRQFFEALRDAMKAYEQNRSGNELAAQKMLRQEQDRALSAHLAT